MDSRRRGGDPGAGILPLSQPEKGESAIHGKKDRKGSVCILRRCLRNASAGGRSGVGACVL